MLKAVCSNILIILVWGNTKISVKNLLRLVSVSWWYYVAIEGNPFTVHKQPSLYRTARHKNSIEN